MWEEQVRKCPPKNLQLHNLAATRRQQRSGSSTHHRSTAQSRSNVCMIPWFWPQYIWQELPLSCMAILVAPYCAIPRDYLSDTPLLRAMGVLVSRHGQLGAIPPPPFLSVSLLESMRSGGAIPPPPPTKGYLSDTCAIPYENKAKRVRYPPLRYYLERMLRGLGVSRTGPLRWR